MLYHREINLPKYSMTKNEIIYAFIDSQNLNLGIRNNVYRKGKIVYKGWKLDFRKFRVYLNDKYNVSKAYIFIGYIKENQTLYNRLKDSGYTIVFKPVVKSSNGGIKGNVDAELVLEVIKQMSNFDKAIIISGDGDFHCLHKYLNNNNKLEYILVPNRYAYSSLLINYKKYIRFLDDLENKLKVKGKKNGSVACSTKTTTFPPS